MYFDSAKYSWSLGHGVGGIQRCSLRVPPLWRFSRDPCLQDLQPLLAPPCTPISELPQGLSALPSGLEGSPPPQAWAPDPQQLPSRRRRLLWREFTGRGAAFLWASPPLPQIRCRLQASMPVSSHLGPLILAVRRVAQPPARGVWRRPPCLPALGRLRGFPALCQHQRPGPHPCGGSHGSVGLAHQWPWGQRSIWAGGRGGGGERARGRLPLHLCSLEFGADPKARDGPRKVVRGLSGRSWESQMRGVGWG